MGKPTGFFGIRPEGGPPAQPGGTGPGLGGVPHRSPRRGAGTAGGRCMNCGCYSVNASDISPVLILLDADIVTTKKVVKAKDFLYHASEGS